MRLSLELGSGLISASGKPKPTMKKILLTVLIGMLVGAVAGALILGLDQWRWQDDPAEIEQWVSLAVLMGATMGGLVGGLIGLAVGLGQGACQRFRSTTSN